MSELAQPRPRPDLVRRLVVAAAAATLVALAVVEFVEPTVVYPDRCMSYPTVDGVPTHAGQFCIRYIPLLGRYELPPEGIPGDVSRALPDGMSGSDNVRLAGVLAFAAAFLGTWWLIGSIRRDPGASDIHRR